MGETDPASITSLYRKTVNDWYLNRTDSLEDRLRQILSLQKDAFGHFDIRVAVTLKDLSWWLMLESRYEESAGIAEQALAVFVSHNSQIENNRYYHEFINNHAVLKTRIAEKLRLDGELGKSNFYFQEAELDLRKAIKLHASAFGDESVGLCDMYGNL